MQKYPSIKDLDRKSTPIMKRFMVRFVVGIIVCLALVFANVIVASNSDVSMYPEGDNVVLYVYAHALVIVATIAGMIITSNQVYAISQFANLDIEFEDKWRIFEKKHAA